MPTIFEFWFCIKKSRFRKAYSFIKSPFQASISFIHVYHPPTEFMCITTRINAVAHTSAESLLKRFNYLTITHVLTAVFFWRRSLCFLAFTAFGKQRNKPLYSCLFFALQYSVKWSLCRNQVSVIVPQITQLSRNLASYSMQLFWVRVLPFPQFVRLS